MKRLLVMVLMVCGCSAQAVDHSTAPSGEAMFDALLNASQVVLNSEPLCDMKSATRPTAQITLGQHLATVLSMSYGNTNATQIASSCGKSFHAGQDGKPLGIWDCKMELMEVDANGKFVSAAMIAFGLSMDRHTLIPGTLRCL